MRGRKYSCCAALPKVCITGASIFSENGFCGGAQASARSSSKMCCCTMSQPVPPKRSGQFTAPQPLRNRIFCQRTMSSLEIRLPSCSLVRMSVGSSASKKARTSVRNFSSSGLYLRSILNFLKSARSIHRDDDLAARRARAQSADCLAAARQRKSFGHGGLDFTIEIQRHEFGHIGGVHLWVPAGELAPEDADDFATLEQRQVQRQLRNAGREAHHQMAPLPGDRAQRRFGVIAADSVIDDIGSVRAAGGLELIGQ